MNLKQKCSVTDHIKQFQQLSLKVKNISEYNLLDLFIGTLKDNIQHEVRLFEPSYRENNVPSYKPPQRLTPQQLDERI